MKSERFVDIDALIDPGIAEIVEHQRLIRGESQRLLQVGFGLLVLCDRQ
ncbi:MAG: hypothetical protein ACHQ4F_16825 [Candidatus Dormibacteria bacterium]